MEEIALALVLAAIAFWDVGSKVTLRVFRILFITAGFALMSVSFTYIATLTKTYTIPSGVVTPYFTQASISNLTTLMLTIANSLLALMLFYIAIEITLYLYQLIQLMKEHKITFRKAFLMQAFQSGEEE